MRRVALLIASLFVAAPAFAQPLQTDQARQKQADIRFAAGLKLHDAGRDPEARVQLEQAYAIVPNPNILFNLARTEQLTGDPVLALRHFKQCLTTRSQLKAGAADLAAKYIAELNPQVGHVSVEAPAETSELTIDDVASPKGEVADVAPGKHVVKAKMSDGLTQTTEIVALAGTTVIAHFTVSPPTTQAPPEVTSPPLSTDPKENKPLPKDDKSSSSIATKWIVVGTAGGVSVALLAVGAGFWIGANSAGDDVNQIRASAPASCQSSNPQCSALADAKSREVRDENLRTLFVSSGAVLLAATVVTAIVWPEPKTQTSWRFTPSVSPSMAGANFTMSF